MASGDIKFCFSSTSFQKKWHWLASTASDRKGAKIQYDFSWFYPKKIFSKHKNKDEFKRLDDSEILSSDFTGLRTSATSLTSLTSATSMASTASKAEPIHNVQFNMRYPVFRLIMSTPAYALLTKTSNLPCSDLIRSNSSFTEASFEWSLNTRTLVFDSKVIFHWPFIWNFVPFKSHVRKFFECNQFYRLAAKQISMCSTRWHATL